MSRTLDRYDEQLTRLGLDRETVRKHAELLAGAVSRKSKPQFAIEDTCRPDNGGVLAADALASAAPVPDEGPATGFVAFVPAAGAASRFSQPLANLINALEAGDDQQLDSSLEGLRNEGAARWPLPERVTQLLHDPSRIHRLTPGERDALLIDLQLPKALLPCVREGYSFLALKHREHGRLRGLEGQVFIAPVGMKAAFARSLYQMMIEAPHERQVTTYFLEQGPQLSTIRFNRDATPYVDGEGYLSPVPAGHGALAQLFPEVKTVFPRAHSLFIRNIDNVMGTHDAAMSATATFLAVHRAILTAVQGVREALARGAVSEAARSAEPLRAFCASRQSPVPGTEDKLARVRDADERVLWEVQARLFHANPDDDMTMGRLKGLYARPVNTLGQVPNTSKDVGGTPCFVHVGGMVQKVCIEVPHVSEEEKLKFLANPAKATHFNPVFAAAEVTPDAGYYARRNQDFWMISEKTYRGKPVMYLETVLYELLGNGQLANCAFVEVPRLVFHPHKTLKDAEGKTLKDWLKD